MALAEEPWKPEVDDDVSVIVEYYGRFKDLAGVKNEVLKVSPVLSIAHGQVCAHVKESYGIVPPYILMVKNMNIIGALKADANMRLADEDVFKFLPVISGG